MVLLREGAGWEGWLQQKGVGHRPLRQLPWRPSELHKEVSSLADQALAPHRERVGALAHFGWLKPPLQQLLLLSGGGWPELPRLLAVAA